MNSFGVAINQWLHVYNRKVNSMVKMLCVLLLLNHILGSTLGQNSKKHEAPVITTQPSNTEVVKGGSAELKCRAKGTPPLRFEWFHNNKRISSTSRRQIYKNGNLFFFRVRHKKQGYSDTGTYHCIVSNDYGKIRSKIVNLSLGFMRKSFKKHPASQNVSLGSDLILTCSPPGGRPKPSVKWLKNDRTLRADGRHILLENKNKRLVIKNFRMSDEGNYVCEAVNVARRRLSNPAVIVGKVPPSFVRKPTDKTVTADPKNQVSFTCKADGNPMPSIVWRKERNETVLPSSDGTLTLTKPNTKDEGVYICSAQNSEGKISTKARLTVNYRPEFAFVSSDTSIREGSKLKLLCLVNSRPKASVQWLHKPTRKIFRINRKYKNVRIEVQQRTVSLIISRVQKSDAGTYACQAVNSVGANEYDVKVLVYGKTEFGPRVSAHDQTITADVNSNTTFICDVEGNPKPSVNWLKVGHGSLGDGVILKDYPNGKKRRYELCIDKVRLRDAGTFHCQAFNKIGTAKKDVVLKVTNKLKLSDPVGVGVPSMPAAVTVFQRKGNKVIIRWEPVQGRAADPVVAYSVGFINVDERKNEEYASDRIPGSYYKFIVKKLKPSTRYRFFVRGVNSKGRGIPSLLSDVVKTGPSRPEPSRPEPSRPPPARTPDLARAQLSIRIGAGGPGELVVSWERLKKNIIIDGYYIYWKVKNTREEFHKEILQNNQSTQYVISDLQNSTKYAVKVGVFKRKLDGPLSNVTYHETSKQSIALTIRVMQNDSDSIAVTWKRLWKKNSGADKVKNYVVWFAGLGSTTKRYEVPAGAKQYHMTIGGLNPGGKYKVWMTASTLRGRHYYSKEKVLDLRDAGTPVKSSRTTMQEFKEFVQQPWFLGLLGGLLLLLVVVILVYCLCKRSSPKKDVDSLTLQLENRNQPESVRKPCESRNADSDVVTPRSRARESVSECESLEGRSSKTYRPNGSLDVSPGDDLDFPEIAVTPNKYERMYQSLEARRNDSGRTYGSQPRKFADDSNSSSRYGSRGRNAYTAIPKPGSVSGDSRSEYDNTRPKYHSLANHTRSPSRNPYPSEAPPDYETAIAENSSCGKDRDDEISATSGDLEDSYPDHLPYSNEKYGNPSSRQSSCSPVSECSNLDSSVGARRKGLKPLPRLTIASVNWAEMLPPPPSHPPPSSVATRSPPPSPTGTSMCSETTYGRSHASSFLPRRSGSVVSGDVVSDLEKATADSVLSGKSKGKSESKLPFDLAGITSDIIMQWADSVTNTSGSDDESQCSSPSRVSGISSDGSFLTDTDFANAVKAAAECGGFNIDIDLNMYKDPISFQPFAGSLSTYNPEASGDANQDSKVKSRKTDSGSKDTEGSRDASNCSRGRRSRSAAENMPRQSSLRDTHSPCKPRDAVRPPKSPTKDKPSPLIVPSSTSELQNNRKTKLTNDVNTNGSAAYVPALTRTSALGKLEPVNRGPIKKKYAVVKTLPQVQGEDRSDYSPNYPSHSLSSSTSNASTVRSSSCPPAMLTDEDTEDDL